MFILRSLNKCFVLGLCILATSCALLPDTSGPSRSERMADLAKIKTQLAMEYEKLGEHRLALSAIEEAISAQSNYDMAWLVKGWIHQNLKMNNEADQAFRRALSISPNSAEINNNYGWFLCNNMKQISQSLVYFDRALADPTYPTPHVAHMNKGICRARGGSYAAAAADLARAKALAPNSPAPLKEMARLKLMEGQLSQAQDLMNQYQRRVEVLGPDDLLLGWKIARSRGNTQAAYEYEAQLRSRYPASDEMMEITGGTGR
ncbi:MAG: type IV pilus biogenesis/stability protein PilW [Neisseriaceae bacterium]|nr:type IV pilus biogenesis/stability protein PilW [Neisseriaceae bacterium]